MNTNDYDSKKLNHITERIKEKGNIAQCAFCKYIMYPKNIIFRTTNMDSILVFNYIGKGGMGSFFHYKGKVFCKKCFHQHSIIIKEIMK